MMTSLLKWACAMNVELWSENGKLKYRCDPAIMTEDFKQELIEKKPMIIARLEEIQAAKAAGWQMFEFGEMYRKAYKNNELCIFRNDDDTYTVWRGKYKYNDQTKPYAENTVLENVPFQRAFERANRYYANATNNNSYNKKVS